MCSSTPPYPPFLYCTLSSSPYIPFHPPPSTIPTFVVGTSYVFCIRQRNEIGWSAFSLPSPIVTTTSTLPPTRPVILVANAYDAVVQWIQDITQTFLEYQIQTGDPPSLL